MNRTLSGRLVVAYESLKTKEKSSLVLAPKMVALACGSSRLQELFITKFISDPSNGLSTWWS